MNIAVVKTGGKQYIVSEGQKLKIEKLNRNEGEEFEFDKILLFARPDADIESAPDVEKHALGQKSLKTGLNERQYRHWDVKIGQPHIDGLKVRAKVLREGRGEKKMVFRYKNKTRYKKKKGHRQPFTEVEILSISYL